MALFHQKWQEFVDSNPINALLGKFKVELIGVGIFSMVANLLTLTPTIYMLQVFAHFLKSKSGATLIAVSFIALFLFVIMAFCEWMRARVLVRAGVRFDEMINSEVFRASFASALNNKSRNLTESFSDLTNLRQFLSGTGVYAILDTPWVPIYMFVAYLLHPLLGLLTLAFVILQVFLLRWCQAYQHEVDEPLLEAQRRTATFVNAKLRNAEVVEAMGMLAGLRARWQRLHRRQLALNAISHDRLERAQGLVKFVQYSVQSLSLAVGALLVIDGRLDPGAMIAANLLVAKACQPTLMLVSSWRQIMSARLSYDRLVNLLSERSDAEAQAYGSVTNGKLEFVGLTATVEGRAEPILSYISAQFNPSELVAIVGPSGSGKSTLARCALGLWPEFKGDVLLDGDHVHLWDRQNLGQHVGYVPQDVSLFDGTVADNICRFSKPDPVKIIEAARAAGVHDMILRFPQGYDTQIGLAGDFLSGGQRQRLALARALYGDPAVLVLDEPNANLDDVGEAALMSAVQRLRDAGRTVLFISHRASVLAAADRIMVLQKGHVVAFGRRESVLSFLQQNIAA